MSDPTHHIDAVAVRPYQLTVEQAARERQAVAKELATASAHLEELRGPYEAARRRTSAAKRRLKEIDAAMSTVAAAGRVKDALAVAGIDYDGPLVVSWTHYADQMNSALLAAVGPKGTGLYVRVPERSRRNQGTERFVRISHATKHGIAEQPDEGSHYEKATPNQLEAGLFAWQARGVGDFGPGSGAYKPLAPPEGGRWKWLKVADGKALTP